jgi:hypothetical protein
LVLLSALTYRFLEAPFNRFAVVLINRMQKSRLRTRPLDGDPYRPVVVEHIGGIESR